MFRLFIFVLFLSFVISCSSSNTRGAIDLKKVDNIGEVNFTDSASKSLSENGFIFTKTDEKDIYNVYSTLKKNQRPMFITTDLVLHTDHLLFDYILRILEIEKLDNHLKELSSHMLKTILTLYRTNRLTPFEKRALERDIGFFAVACRTLGMDIHIPKFIDKKVKKELLFIEQAEGFENSPLFEIKEDYSQYKPRGHYTRNETLKRYFRAMMWYGRMGFYLKPPHSNISGDPERLGKSLTLSALYITYALKRNPALLDGYNWVYNITSFFVGESDDLGVKDYLRLMDRVYGNVQVIQKLSRQENFNKFIEEAEKTKPPRIISGLLTDRETREAARSFKFMGQRFIPDSYMFQNLVYDKVTNFTGKGRVFTAIPSQVGIVRGFPRGLDVMAVLGSDDALNILSEEGDTSFKGYNEQMAKLRKEFSSLDEKEWRENIYYNFIYQFKKLLENVEEFKNPYINKKQWVKKVLNTLLGAWAELRHDTILYAKQSYTIMVTSVSPHIPARQMPAYVEAYPHFYSENLEFVKSMVEMLEKQNLVPDEVVSNLKNFESILLQLQEISEKENRMEKLNDKTIGYLRSVPDRLEGVVKFSPSIMKEITNGTDSKMAVIADVHTDVNTNQVLEEGVGNPLKIFILVPVNNRPYLMEGGTFSYYEFKQKMSNRLNDEEWQKRITDGKLPPLQKWFKELVK